MSPDTRLHKLLGERGLIADKLRSYESRPQQIDMAKAVAAAFETGERLLIEAGTGVGKSFAYLVPAIEHVTQQGGRVVVSTHTIALQEQLIEKDIPFLQSVYPDGFSAVLVKGRSNYLGLRRLARASARQERLFDAGNLRSDLHRIEDWAYRTEDGSLSDLSEQPNPAVWDRVRSDGDDCFGRKCPHYKACFYQRARHRAADAQILVVNHALLCADIAVRKKGASFLPDYDLLVIDEAHTLERVAGDHLGFSVSNAQLRHLLNTLHRDKSRRGLLDGKRDRDAIRGVETTRRRIDAYFDALNAWRVQRGDWNGRLREAPPVADTVAPGLRAVHGILREARERRDNEEDRSELNAMMERCTELAASVEQWHAHENDGWVYWMSCDDRPGGRVTLAARPIDVGPELRASLFEKVGSAVLTSATLTTTADDPFGYLRGRLGLDDARTVRLGSPFDYRRQLAVHVESGLPDPGRFDAFTAAACEALKKHVGHSDGRALVLFTSYRMLQHCADVLSDFFSDQKMPLLVQGSGLPRSQMLDAFRAEPRSVLFGTDTFWTGVDVPGDALTNVIIVRLPFASPGDPMIEARIERIRNAGGNPFMDFQLPEAVLKFRQGVGRLIRSRRDKGIVVILDPRVRTKPYGRAFIDALPDCEVIVAEPSDAPRR